MDTEKIIIAVLFLEHVQGRGMLVGVGKYCDPVYTCTMNVIYNLKRHICRCLR